MARKRMLITLDKDTHSKFMEFSTYTGIPAASLAAQLLKEFKPTLNQIIEVLEKAKTEGQGVEKSILNKMLKIGQKELSSHVKSNRLL